MYLFMLLLPVFVALLFLTIQMVPKKGSEPSRAPKIPTAHYPSHLHVYLQNDISIGRFFILISASCLVFLPAVVIIFRLVIHNVQTLFLLNNVLWYASTLMFLPLIVLFCMYRVMRHAPWWQQNWLFLMACIIEFWVNVLFLLIAYQYLTYIEYFVFPIIQISLLITLCFLFRQYKFKLVVLLLLLIAFSYTVSITALYSFTLLTLMFLLIFIFFVAIVFSLFTINRSYQLQM